MKEWTPFPSWLVRGRFAALSRATRFVYLEIKLRARETGGELVIAGRYRSALDAVHSQIGGDRREVARALVEITSPGPEGLPDPEPLATVEEVSGAWIVMLRPTADGVKQDHSTGRVRAYRERKRLQLRALEEDRNALHGVSETSEGERFETRQRREEEEKRKEDPPSPPRGERAGSGSDPHDERPSGVVPVGSDLHRGGEPHPHDLGNFGLEPAWYAEAVQAVTGAPCTVPRGRFDVQALTATLAVHARGLRGEAMRAFIHGAVRAWAATWQRGQPAHVKSFCGFLDAGGYRARPARPAPAKAPESEGPVVAPEEHRERLAELAQILGGFGQGGVGRA